MPRKTTDAELAAIVAQVDAEGLEDYQLHVVLEHFAKEMRKRIARLKGQTDATVLPVVTMTLLN